MGKFKLHQTLVRCTPLLYNKIVLYGNLPVFYSQEEDHCGVAVVVVTNVPIQLLNLAFQFVHYLVVPMVLLKLKIKFSFIIIMATDQT